MNSFSCQNFITPSELQSLIVDRPDELLFIIKCDSYKVVYASESSINAIGYFSVSETFLKTLFLLKLTKNFFEQNELVDRLFLEFLHPSETKHVKEQLLIYDTNKCKNFIMLFILINIFSNFILKGKTIYNEFSPGNRRSFVCRLRVKSESNQFKSRIVYQVILETF